LNEQKIGLEIPEKEKAPFPITRRERFLRRDQFSLASAAISRP
jgi:hypothetical protein